MERKLAAILVADIVGYSAQMERDETGTFNRLTDRRQTVFGPEIARHHGRIFKQVGDGLLAEFGSAVAAVECAVAVQKALAQRNEGIDPADRIHARIGINLGEVIVDGEDLFGDGVNLAARLEQLAEPGGIVVSEKVQREVQRRSDVRFLPIGFQKVKNFAEPVLVFLVTGDRVAAAELSRPRYKHFGLSWMRRGTTAVFSGFCAITAAIWVFFPTSPPKDWAPSVIVQPFTNLSGDARNDLLELAIPDAIQTVFSQTPLLRVRTDPSDSAGFSRADLGIRTGEAQIDYRLTGSIRESGKKTVVSIQLVDGSTNEILWTQSLENHALEMHQIQQEVASRAYETYAAYSGMILQFEVTRSWEVAQGELDEFGFHRRGLAADLGFTDGGTEQAVRIWTEGLERYPRSALLRLELARVYALQVRNGTSVDIPRDVETAWTLLLETDDIPVSSRFEEWLRHYVRALVVPLATEDLNRALREAEAASRMMPIDPSFHSDLALVAAYAGDTKLALSWAELGVFSGNDPTAEDWVILGKVYLLSGRTEAAAVIFDEFWDRCPGCAAVAWVRSGRIQDARELVEAGLEVLPEWSIEMERKKPTGQHDIMVAELMEPYLADLRAAGLD